MADYQLWQPAKDRLEDIYLYSKQAWGKQQAEVYVASLFARFEEIAQGTAQSRLVPAEFQADLFFTPCQKHFIYWKRLSDGSIGIVTILHQSMHQIERFKEDFSLP